MSGWRLKTHAQTGFVLLGISLLIVVSLIISTIDRQMHSKCGSSCGFTLNKREIVNPLDSIFTFFSAYFPLDLAFYLLSFVYVFICSCYAMVKLGVRFFIFSLYEVRSSKTMPHGLILGSWLLMFAVLQLYFQVPNITPQYATFGNQHYYDVVVSGFFVTVGLRVAIVLNQCLERHSRRYPPLHGGAIQRQSRGEWDSNVTLFYDTHRAVCESSVFGDSVLWRHFPLCQLRLHLDILHIVDLASYAQGQY